VRAEGDDFSAGAEVSVFIGLDEAQAAELMTTVLSLIGAIEDLPVPALALTHGQCYAGALEVCLACDLIWAAEAARLGRSRHWPAASHTRAGPSASRRGSAQDAPRRWYSPAILPPETLASWGLINRVVPADRLTGEGRAFAESLASGPTRAHAATKRILHSWRSGGVAAADEVTHGEGPAVMLSQDLQDGIASLQRSGPGHATFNNR
jgi:enoyl-CoA hydratase/carnithine racemase